MPKKPEDSTPLIVSSAPALKGKYGKGHFFDTEETKVKVTPTRALFGASSGIPAAYSLEQHSGPVQDQGQYSSCTGWSTAQAIQLRMSVINQPIELPSWIALYTTARALDRQQRGMNVSTALVDQGTYPSLVFEGASDGVPTISQWPFKGINDEPDLLELEYASAFKLLSYYRIDSIGPQKVRDVMQAIASGYPVVIGTQVDQAFEDYDGDPSKPIAAPDPDKLLGGHGLHLLGYREDGAIRGKNQWGAGWGDDGYFWALPNWVASDYLSDAYVIDVAPTGAFGGASPRTVKAA